MTSKTTILLLTGESATGKSTLAEALANARNGLHLSEREISRSLARGAGFARSRAWVEHIGLAAASVAITGRTLELLGEHTDMPLIIIDGAYDASLPTKIQDQLDAVTVRTVAFEMSYEERLGRYAKRIGAVSLEAAAQDMAFLDDIKHVVGMAELIAQADLHVSSIEDSTAAWDAINSMLDTQDGDTPRRV